MRSLCIVRHSTLVRACAAASVVLTAGCKGEAGAPPAALVVEAVAAVEITPINPSVSVGRTVQLVATALDSTGNPLEGRRMTWRIADPGVATVDDEGIVTGVAEGSTPVSAETGGIAAGVVVTVLGQAVASVTVLPSQADVVVGGSVLLAATTRDTAGAVLTGRPIAWSSSDTSIASVDDGGLVTTKQVGSVTITATSEGVSGTASVAATMTSGPCSNSLSNVSLPLCDGTYTQDVTPSTFPANAVIQAQNPGKVRFTGQFDAGNDLTFRGIVISNGDQKQLGSRTTYEEMSFVGGAPCGNAVNTLSGSNTTVRRSAFYGKGGRYLFLPWHVSGVVLQDVLFRTDGGWGEGGSGCNEFEPNAALNDYDSPNFVCIGCILFDGIVTAGSESETLGGLGVNCHLSSAGAVFDRNVIVNSPGGFWADGLGTCDSVVVKNSAAFGASEYGIKRNVQGTTTATNFTTDTRCGAFKGTINLVESRIGGQNDGCGGGTAGAGATVTLNTTFLDNPRWRREMCDEQGVTRGWCGTALTLSAYLQSFF